MIDYIKSDLFRYCGKCGFLAFVCEYFRNRTFRLQVAFRLAQGKGFAKLLGLFLRTVSGMRKYIQLPLKTRVGYGLYIAHGGPVIINPTAVIGNNVNLSQFTTIGSNHAKAAVIGDNVYIGPGVCIVEYVKIGNNVTIGAGSVVTKDIPDNATAAGNYAKVLNYSRPGRYIKNKWPVSSR